MKYTPFKVFRQTIVVASVLVAVMFSSTSARAQDNWPNWYIGLSGQVAFINETNANVNGVNQGDVDFDTGWGAGISLGFRPYVSGSWLDNTRIELEYTRRGSDFQDLTFVGGGVANLDGQLNSNNWFVNLFYDFDTGTRWSPYLGAGVGVANLEFDSLAVNVKDEDSTFAYQGMAGLSTSFFGLPHARFGVGYRYVGMSDPEFDTTNGGTLDHEFDSHNLEANARFFF